MNEMNEATCQFIREHADSDVHALALLGSKYPDVDMSAALAQIDGKQRAQQKLPSWAALDDVRYPVHLSMEQCSSEHTAEYKSALAEKLMSLPAGKAVGDSHESSVDTIAASADTLLVDLTGGFGVDFSFMSRKFDRAVYVEHQDTLCEIARHNFRLLHLHQTEIVCGDGVDYLEKMDKADVIFLDPARRDANGGRVVAISDCTPDVMQVRDLLLEKSCYTIIKLSPMLDWHKAVSDLNASGQCVSQLHVVSVDNECKELLLVITKEDFDTLQIYCVNDSSCIAFAMLSDAACPTMSVELSDIQKSLSDNATLFLYEPNASIMKVGCFSILENRYGVKALGKNSHLFVASHLIDDFPGRRFIVDAMTTMNRKDLREHLSGIDKANIAVRNFNMSVAELRKRLKINEGGDIYLFATTISDRQHVLLICHKA